MKRFFKSQWYQWTPWTWFIMMVATYPFMGLIYHHMALLAMVVSPNNPNSFPIVQSLLALFGSVSVGHWLTNMVTLLLLTGVANYLHFAWYRQLKWLLCGGWFVNILVYFLFTAQHITTVVMGLSSGVVFMGAILIIELVAMWIYKVRTYQKYATPIWLLMLVALMLLTLTTSSNSLTQAYSNQLHLTAFGVGLFVGVIIFIVDAMKDEIRSNSRQK